AYEPARRPTARTPPTRRARGWHHGSPPGRDGLSGSPRELLPAERGDPKASLWGWGVPPPAPDGRPPLTRLREHHRAAEAAPAHPPCRPVGRPRLAGRNPSPRQAGPRARR